MRVQKNRRPSVGRAIDLYRKLQDPSKISCPSSFGCDWVVSIYAISFGAPFVSLQCLLLKARVAVRTRACHKASFDYRGHSRFDYLSCNDVNSADAHHFCLPSW
jgi:hypothetical protein